MGFAAYWRLKERPFEEVGDPRFFFASEGHREALDRLSYVANDQNMNISLLTGEIGSGKTITKKVLIASLPSNRFEVIDFENSNFGFTDLLYDVVCRIAAKNPHAPAGRGSDIAPRGDKFLLMQIFRQQLEYLQFQEKRHLVAIFDEAQQIDDATLDEIKNLTNFSATAENFLTVLFVGQPELREKIKRSRQLDQRIFLRFHLNNLDYKGSVDYIEHRLRVAGAEKCNIFAVPSYELIFRSTGGIPREINRLCKLALQYGYAHDHSEISGDDIQLIIDDVKVHSG